MDTHVNKDTSRLRREGDENPWKKKFVIRSSSPKDFLKAGGSLLTSRILLIKAVGLDSVNLAERAVLDQYLSGTVRVVV